MKKLSLRQWIFMAICCDLGLFSKRLIAPAANIVTDSLHIPGGITTAFSLMFLVIGAAMLPFPGAASVMGVVQSVLALSFGMVGSMGLLSPIGYIAPGIAIDIMFAIGGLMKLKRPAIVFFANMIASLTACMAANLIVFRLHGIPLILYAAVALFCGGLCGLLAEDISERLHPILNSRRSNSV